MKKNIFLFVLFYLLKICIFADNDKGDLIINTEYSTLDIYIDNVRYSTTKYKKIKDLPTGRHSLSLKGAFSYYNTYFNIKSGETTELSITPIKYGRLEYQIPPNTKLRLFYQNRIIVKEETQGVIDKLKPGKYRIELTGKNITTYNSNIDIEYRNISFFYPDDIIFNSNYIEIKNNINKVKKEISDHKIEITSLENKLKVLINKDNRSKNLARLSWTTTGLSALTTIISFFVGNSSYSKYNEAVDLPSIIEHRATAELTDSILTISTPLTLIGTIGIVNTSPDNTQKQNLQMEITTLNIELNSLESRLTEYMNKIGES